MSNDYGVLFPTSVVGSMPRDDFVKELISDDGLPEDEFNRLMDGAIGYVVALQERAGIDVITDGEWRRKSYIGVIAELAHGFELGNNPADGRPWTIVTDKLSSKKTGFIAREAAYLKTITKRGVKVTLPAPALLGERMWDPEKSKKAYPTRDEFVQACVPILHKELECLRDEGVTIAQIDDPHLCLFVDPEVRASYDDAQAASDFSVDMVNQVVEGVKGIKIAVHLCRRAGARARGETAHGGGYGPIIGQLNNLKVHHLTMEFTDPSAGDMAVLTELREDFEIGLGCVSCTPGKIDPAEAIVERAEKALKYLTPNRLTLNPDCGFAPGSAAVVDVNEVFTKLKNEAEAAKRLREKYG